MVWVVFGNICVCVCECWGSFPSLMHMSCMPRSRPFKVHDIIRMPSSSLPHQTLCVAASHDIISIPIISSQHVLSHNPKPDPLTLIPQNRSERYGRLQRLGTLSDPNFDGREMRFTWSPPLLLISFQSHSLSFFYYVSRNNRWLPLYLLLSDSIVRF